MTKGEMQSGNNREEKSSLFIFKSTPASVFSTWVWSLDSACLLSGRGGVTCVRACVCPFCSITSPCDWSLLSTKAKEEKKRIPTMQLASPAMPHIASDKTQQGLIP